MCSNRSSCGFKPSKHYSLNFGLQIWMNTLNSACNIYLCNYCLWSCPQPLYMLLKPWTATNILRKKKIQFRMIIISNKHEIHKMIYQKTGWITMMDYINCLEIVYVDIRSSLTNFRGSCWMNGWLCFMFPAVCLDTLRKSTFLMLRVCICTGNNIISRRPAPSLSAFSSTRRRSR